LTSPSTPGVGPARRACARDLIDAHFAGRISPEAERRMREHLPDCADCRRHYERHLVLAGLDPGSLPAMRRIGRALGLRLPASSAATASAPRPMRWMVAATASAAALAAVFLVVRPRGDGGQYTARGGAEPAMPALFVYELQPVRELAPGDRVRRTDDLAFAYANPGGYRRLLVFGVDEHRHVYWYYPAWTNPADDPRAVPLPDGRGDRTKHELPEGIRHDIDGDHLTLYAEFLNDDVGVRSVEARVAAAGAPGDPLLLPGAAEQRIALTLEP
jgi:Putative zinc-finger